MEIHNISEDIVFDAVQKIFEVIKNEGDPEGKCLCEQCKLDTICYTLNRVEPRYIVSNRGITRLNQNGLVQQQTEADIAALIYKGLKLVNHNQRPVADHDDSVKIARAEMGPAFDIPTIVGRLFDGGTFAPLEEGVVELRSGGTLVSMQNLNWQNPFALIKHTPGSYTFWPVSVPANAVDEKRTFEFSLKIESPQYETLTHVFRIPVISEIQAPHSFSLDKTFKLPDLYMFQPGGEEEDI